MTPVRLAQRGIIAFAVLMVASHTGFADTHKDEKLGFSIDPPKRWRVIPLSDAERWIAAKFQSERDFAPRKTLGAYHRPELMVVVLPLESGGAKVTRDEDRTTVEVRNSYKDFRDYLEKNAKEAFSAFGDGGFYFSAEKETTVRGTKVIQYEITFDKLTDNPRRIHGWAYYADDCIYGVMADYLIEWEKKLKPEVFAALGSFRMFARTGSLRTGTTTGDGITLVDKTKDDEVVTDEQIEKRRRELTEQRFARIKEGLGDGWRVRESKHFIAVTNTDDRYTKELLDHAEALRSWLDQTLGFVGSGFVGRTIIRICADEREAEGYTSSIPWTSVGRIEVVTYKDREGWSDWAMTSLNRGIFAIWMRDKNPELLWGTPGWLRSGIEGVVEHARSKRGRVIFDADTWDSVQLKNLRRDERLLHAREFFELIEKDLWERERSTVQCIAFVKFLLVGSGARSPRYRSIIPDYTKNLIFLLDEQASADDASKNLAKSEPQTEAEEDDLYRARRSAWDARELDRLNALLERTFDGWDDAEWNRLNAAFVREIK